MIDAREQWRDEPDAEIGVNVIRIDRDDRHLIPFTFSLVTVMLHFLQNEPHRGYIRCNGHDCLLCRVGKKPTKYYLLPMYDTEQGSVGVLLINETTRPGALRPQLKTLVDHVDSHPGDKLLVIINKPTPIKFHVHWQKLPAGADDGAAVIESFMSRLRAGKIRLASVRPTDESADFAELPEIAIAMRRGSRSNGDCPDSYQW